MDEGNTSTPLKGCGVTTVGNLGRVYRCEKGNLLGEKKKECVCVFETGLRNTTSVEKVGPCVLIGVRKVVN